MSDMQVTQNKTWKFDNAATTENCISKEMFRQSFATSVPNFVEIYNIHITITKQQALSEMKIQNFLPSKHQKM